MRIGFISDLHIDINRHHNFITLISELAKEKKLDLLVILGDIADGAIYTIKFYRELKEKLKIPFRTLVGNHDIYVPNTKYYTSDQIKKKSRQFYHDLDSLPTSLVHHPIITDNWLITGINGWYDYTFAKNFSEKRGPQLAHNWISANMWPDQKKINGKQINYNRDKMWVLNQIMAWKKQVIKIKIGKRKLVVASHFLPTKNLIHILHIPFYDHFLYQLGSERYRKAFEENKVSISISGHSHMPIKIIKNNIKYINVSLGYNFQWSEAANALEELKKTMFILEG